MIFEWIAHLKDPEHKKLFTRQVHGSREVLERLDQLLEQREQALETEELSVKTFDSPSWPYKQAYMNGYKAALKTCRKYLDLKEENDRQLIQSN